MTFLSGHPQALAKANIWPKSRVYEIKMLSVNHQTRACGPINHTASFVFAEIGPVTITTDPKKFQYELRELYVQVGSEFTSISLRKPRLKPGCSGHLALIKAAGFAHV